MHFAVIIQAQFVVLTHHFLEERFEARGAAIDPLGPATPVHFKQHAYEAGVDAVNLGQQPQPVPLRRHLLPFL